MFKALLGSAMLLFFIALPSAAQDNHKKLWGWSVAALAAGTTFDAVTSINRPEANQYLATNGEFRGKGIAIKFGIVGVQIGLEALFGRRHKAGYGAMSSMNFMWGGMYTTAGIHNVIINRGSSNNNDLPDLNSMRRVCKVNCY